MVDINMKKPLDIYDDMPRAMKRYISNYGWHFNKDAYEYALESMRDRNNSRLKPFSKEQVDSLLKAHGVEIENKNLYDYVYIASMCMADYYGSCIKDDKSMCLYIKDTVDDIDASDETTFRRWVATMVGNGRPIEWDELC